MCIDYDSYTCVSLDGNSELQCKGCTGKSCQGDRGRCENIKKDFQFSVDQKMLNRER